MELDRKMAYIAGGVFGAAFLALSFWLFTAWSEASEKAEEYDMAKAQLNSPSVFGAEPFPCVESVEVEKKRIKALNDWYGNVRNFVAGSADRAFDPNLSLPVFKDRLLACFNELQALPGAVDGKLVVPGFLFGLGDVLRLAPRANGDIVRLQRQLDFITCLMHIMATNGVDIVADIVCEKQQPVQETPTATRGRAGQRNRRGSVKNNDAAQMQKLVYVVMFKAKPEAFVGVMEQLSGASLSKEMPFVVIDDFEINAEYTATDDFIVSRLENRKQALRSLSDGSRDSGGRRRGAFIAGSDDPEKRKAELEALLANITLVDSKADSAMRVKLTLSVYDFGTAKFGVKAPPPQAAKPAAAPANAKPAKPKPKKGGKKSKGGR